MRKLHVYIAASLDGYIAKPDDNLDFLSIVQTGNEDYGYNEFISSIDTVLVGRRTYDWVLKHATFPHRDKRTYVFTRRPAAQSGNVIFYSGDIVTLVQALKQEEGKDIFCDGGADIIHQLAQADLIDEYIISFIPVLVGGGTKLFKDGRPQQRVQLVNAKTFDSGLTQLHYKRIRPHL